MQQSPPESTKKAALADSIDLSIIIPAFNEELVLLECLKTVEDYAEKQGNSYEIIVIDDYEHNDYIGVKKACIDYFKIINCSNNSTYNILYSNYNMLVIQKQLINNTFEKKIICI